MTQLIGLLSGSDTLGFPAFFRVVFERGTIAFGDHDLEVGMARTYEGLSEQQLVTAINTNPRIDGDSAVVVDLRVNGGAQGNTVADLLTTLEELTYLVSVRSLERISQAEAYGQPAEQGRADAKTQAEQAQQHESITGKLSDAATAVGSAAQSAVITLIVAAVAAVALYGFAKAKGHSVLE